MLLLSTSFGGLACLAGGAESFYVFIHSRPPVVFMHVCQGFNVAKMAYNSMCVFS